MSCDLNLNIIPPKRKHEAFFLHYLWIHILLRLIVMLKKECYHIFRWQLIVSNYWCWCIWRLHNMLCLWHNCSTWSMVCLCFTSISKTRRLLWRVWKRKDRLNEVTMVGYGNPQGFVNNMSWKLHLNNQFSIYSMKRRHLLHKKNKKITNSLPPERFV